MRNQQGKTARHEPIQDAEPIDVVGGRISVVGRMETHDDDVVLIRAHMSLGESVLLHAHCDPECFYVLEGRIEVFLGDNEPRWHLVGQGQSLFVAGGVKHAVRNTSNMPAAIVGTTVRLARFLREVGRSASGDDHRPPTSADFETLQRKARGYGYWLASPEDLPANF